MPLQTQFGGLIGDHSLWTSVKVTFTSCWNWFLETSEAILHSSEESAGILKIF